MGSCSEPPPHCLPFPADEVSVLWRFVYAKHLKVGKKAVSLVNEEFERKVILLVLKVGFKAPATCMKYKLTSFIFERFIFLYERQIYN